MRPSLRWQLLLAAVGFALILAILSFQAQTVEIVASGGCTTRVPARGGAFVEGIVGAPRTLNPLLNDAYPVDRDLTSLIFDGLVQYNVDTRRFEPALAESWTLSEDGRSLTFTLRPNVTWHDGQPVTAADVAFTYGLLQAEAYPGLPAVGNLWRSVTITPIDDTTIQFDLAEPYAPFLEAVTRGIVPAHLLRETAVADLPSSGFNQFPIGTGPFLVDPTQDWTQTGRLRLLPNPDYWSDDTQLEALEFQFFPDSGTLADAFAAGSLQAINSVPPALVATLAAQPDTSLFTAPDDRYTAVLFNLSPSGHSAVQNGAVRQALAYGLDRQRLLDEVVEGQGLLLDGPYLPASWAYAPAALTTYSYNPISATAALDSSGWPLAEGAAVRQQEETSLTLRLLTLESERPLATAVADQWAQVGVMAEVTAVASGVELRQALADGLFDAALVTIAPSIDPDLYDFWSQEALVDGQNYAGWNNRRASEALEGGRKLWRLEERRPFYDTFLRLYSTDLPAITLYQHLTTYAVHSSVQALDIGRIDTPRERYRTFNSWFLNFAEVPVLCPAEGGS